MDNAWLLDELAFAGGEHVDIEFVGGYDHKQGQPDPAPEVEAFWRKVSMPLRPLWTLPRALASSRSQQHRSSAGLWRSTYPQRCWNSFAAKQPAMHCPIDLSDHWYATVK